MPRAQQAVDNAQQVHGTCSKSPPRMRGYHLAIVQSGFEWACLAQEAGSEEYRKQRKALQAEARKARQQLLEAEAALVQEQGIVAELQHLLALAERRAETPPKAHCGTQVSGCSHSISKIGGGGWGQQSLAYFRGPCWGLHPYRRQLTSHLILLLGCFGSPLQGFLSNTRTVRNSKGHAQVTPRAGANTGTPLTQQLVGSNTPSCISAIRDAYKSGTKAPASSAPPARTQTPLFMQVRQHSALRPRPVP